MSKILSDIEINKYFLKIIQTPSLIETLDKYERDEILIYAEKNLLSALSLIDKIVREKPDYNYPNEFKEKPFEYWYIHNLSYKDAKFVIDQLTKKSTNKNIIKPRINREKNLKSNLSPTQIRFLYENLRGFLFEEKTDFQPFSDIFSNRKLSELRGFIYIKGSNRLFGYFLKQLYAKTLIDNSQYKSIIEKSKSFKGQTGKLLCSADISVAVSNYENSENNPVGFEKIDMILDEI